MKKLTTGIAVVLIAAIATASGAFAALQNPNQFYSGYAPVPGGNYQSGVIARVEYHTTGGIASAQMQAWDDNVYTDAKKFCVTVIAAVGSQLVPGAKVCQNNLVEGQEVVVLSSHAGTVFGANYETESDTGAKRSWGNTIFG